MDVEKPKLAEVPQITRSSLVDIPAKLREMAAAIEKDEHGNVRCLAIAAWCIDKGGMAHTHIFGYGPDSDHPNVTAVLLAGANKAARMLDE